MKASTIAALKSINHRFYSRYSDSFAATRSHPWPGWRRAMAPFLSQGPGEPEAGPARSILDVGCGNGRFGAFLSSVSREPYRYLGVDYSSAMIKTAKQRLMDFAALEARFEVSDVDHEGLGRAIKDEQFDLIVLFGILHHIAGSAQRRHLLRDLAAVLKPGGTMALSFWQFGGLQRFRRRLVEWQDHNRACEVTVDESDLERGDYLLLWGGEHGEAPDTAIDSEARRYCHFSDPDEAAAAVGSLDLEIVDRFSADGRSGDLNLYFVLARPE